MTMNQEFDFTAAGYAGELICGVDEAGRGPLAGPVFAAAVILDPGYHIAGLRDSKKLSEKKREALASEIKAHALAWSIGQCSEDEIDSLNILQATMLAMRRAVEGLHLLPSLALIDGNRCPVMGVRSEAIVKGDDKVPAISAASILAKTARDGVLMQLDMQYPQYAFSQHKGYPTELHLERLRLHGVSPVHRKSYAPVRALLAQPHVGMIAGPSARESRSGSGSDATMLVCAAPESIQESTQAIPQA